MDSHSSTIHMAGNSGNVAARQHGLKHAVPSNDFFLIVNLVWFTLLCSGVYFVVYFWT